MGMYLETLTLEACIGARTHNSSVRLMVNNLNHSTTIVTILRIIERREMYRQFLKSFNTKNMEFIYYQFCLSA
jgi:hypothetical protein